MQKNICDNCSQEATQKRGIVIEKDYCDDCVIPIDDMLKEIDDLHDQCAEKWTKGVKAIRSKIKGVIPDV